jgi:hypothetical protein
MYMASIRLIPSLAEKTLVPTAVRKISIVSEAAIGPHQNLRCFRRASSKDCCCDPTPITVAHQPGVSRRPWYDHTHTPLHVRHMAVQWYRIQCASISQGGACARVRVCA